MTHSAFQTGLRLQHELVAHLQQLLHGRVERAVSSGLENTCQLFLIVVTDGGAGHEQTQCIKESAIQLHPQRGNTNAGHENAKGTYAKGTYAKHHRTEKRTEGLDPAELIFDPSQVVITVVEELTDRKSVV